MAKEKKEKIVKKKQVAPKIKKVQHKVAKVEVKAKPKVKVEAKVKKITKVQAKAKPVRIKAKPPIPPVVLPQKPMESIVVKPPVKPVEVPKEAVKEFRPRPEIKKETVVVKEAVKHEPLKAAPKAEVKATPVLEPAVELKEVELRLPITVKDLSVRLQEKPSVIIKTLMDMRIMVGINQVLDEAVVEKR